MRTSRRTIASTLTGLAFASLLLAGCATGGSDAETSGSGSGSSGGGNSGAAESSQTTEEACSVVKSGVEATYADLEASLGDIQSDPDKAAAAVGALGDAFEKSASQVTNEDVRATVDDIVGALDGFSEQVRVLAEAPETVDQAAVTAASTELQEGFAKLGTTCP
ncbi:hypothetical protein [Conyzicola sp.]|uniref:hypothetical protein n=1 Tax=Conyzicola sp. TaxID=1969404 RepID=UPI003988E5B2